MTIIGEKAVDSNLVKHGSKRLSPRIMCSELETTTLVLQVVDNLVTVMERVELSHSN